VSEWLDIDGLVFLPLAVLVVAAALGFWLSRTGRRTRWVIWPVGLAFVGLMALGINAPGNSGWPYILAAFALCLPGLIGLWIGGLVGRCGQSG
jgi:hypothetical protein